MSLLPVELFNQNIPALKALLSELVQNESPSTDKAAVDRLGARLALELQALGGQVQVFPSAAAGDNLLCRWGEGPGGILLLSHMDTVYPLGTLAGQPFYERDGCWFGPGVIDMKGSIAMLLTILRLFREQGTWPNRPLMALFTSDEETGSASSRQLIEETARQAELVLCLEPAMANGAVKTARKGAGDIELVTGGFAAHAGSDHHLGRNAIEAMAHYVLAAQQLTDYARGTTVNVGVIRGGTRPNVVPSEATALVDFRVPDFAEYQRLEYWIAGLQPVIEGTQIRASIDLNRPPMPRDATMIRTFEKARVIAERLGLTMTEGSTGGVSDANFVAPLGIPVLDGLGPVGDRAHSSEEFGLIDSFAPRSAILAALLMAW